MPDSDVAKSLLFLSACAARLLGGPAAAIPPAAADDDGASRAAATAAEAWRQRGAAVADSYASARTSGGGPLAGFGAGAAELEEDAELTALGWARPIINGVGNRLSLGFGCRATAPAAAAPAPSADLQRAPHTRQDGAPPPWALAADDLPWPHLVVAAAAAEAELGADGAGRGDAAAGNAAGHQQEVDWAELVPGYSGSLPPLLQGED
jgi:hypothetical protein